MVVLVLLVPSLMAGAQVAGRVPRVGFLFYGSPEAAREVVIR